VAAELFLPGVMSTPQDELNAAFTPDGRELYWSLNSVQGQQGMGVIVFSRKKSGGGWNNPELASFSGQYSDYDPFVAPDGQRLFFISNRPKGAATWNPQDFDIYVVEKKGDGWSEPTRMDAPVNSDAPEYYPSVAANGDLFFSTTREGSKSFDIFRSRFSEGQYQQPENLGEAVNGTANTAEIDNYVAPDESFIVFAAFRQGGIGGQDLYISFKQGDGWSPSQILPKGINSPAREYTPIGSPDGRYLYFTSMRGFTTAPPSRRMPLKEWRDSIQSIRNGNGNVYRVPLSSVLALRPNP
jgi:Tol biopolymer transport system component